MVVMVTGNTTIAVMISQQQQQESIDEKMSLPRSWVDCRKGIEIRWKAKNS